MPKKLEVFSSMAKNVIIISGNIGSGKSTLIEYIKKKTDALCIQEFIDKAWRDHFYKDRKGYTHYFEKSCMVGLIAPSPCHGKLLLCQ